MRLRILAMAMAAALTMCLMILAIPHFDVNAGPIPTPTPTRTTGSVRQGMDALQKRKALQCTPITPTPGPGGQEKKVSVILGGTIYDLARQWASMNGACISANPHIIEPVMWSIVMLTSMRMVTDFPAQPEKWTQWDPDLVREGTSVWLPSNWSQVDDLVELHHQWIIYLQGNLWHEYGRKFYQNLLLLNPQPAAPTIPSFLEGPVGQPSPSPAPATVTPIPLSTATGVPSLTPTRTATPTGTLSPYPTPTPTGNSSWFDRWHWWLFVVGLIVMGIGTWMQVGNHATIVEGFGVIIAAFGVLMTVYFTGWLHWTGQWSPTILSLVGIALLVWGMIFEQDDIHLRNRLLGILLSAIGIIMAAWGTGLFQFGGG